MTRPRAVVLSLLALAIAAMCIRLGIWQLDRLAERRAENVRLSTSIAAEPIEIAEIPADSTHTRGRRVALRGTYDFVHQITLVNRSRDGAPGVNVLTPLRIDGRDTAIIVNRGWVYSPDGATIDLAQWHEPDSAAGTAYVSWLRESGVSNSGSVSAASARRILRPDRSAIAAALPYPIAPYQLVLLGDSTASAAYGFAAEAARDTTVPVRLLLPALDEGPHKSYAIQWFCFATIAVVGTAAVLRKDRRRPESDGTGKVA